jgi:hypothetical protein
LFIFEREFFVVLKIVTGGGISGYGAVNLNAEASGGAGNFNNDRDQRLTGFQWLCLLNLQVNRSISQPGFLWGISFLNNLIWLGSDTYFYISELIIKYLVIS